MFYIFLGDLYYNGNLTLLEYLNATYGKPYNLTNKGMAAGVPGIMWMPRDGQFGIWDGSKAYGMPNYILTTKRVFLFKTEGIC